MESRDRMRFAETELHYKISITDLCNACIVFIQDGF
jgi:hypothetical protein